MESYIRGNNELRAKAKSEGNEFLVSLFKLCNNAVYGKTMENVRNRQDMKLTVDRERAIKWFSRIDFKDATYIDGLYLIQMHKTRLVYDKPVQVGCAILDISKVRMLDFHYHTMEKHFHGKSDLIYSDTDSLVYHVKHDNLYEWMAQNPAEFDLSNMVKHKSNANYNVLGKLKSEVSDNIITEFLALSPKCYSYRYLVEGKTKESKKAKGISMSVVDKTIKYDDYHEVLTTEESQTRKIYGIRSFNQQLFTVMENKVALTPFYDKMQMIDEIKCEPYGYSPK